MTRSCDQLRNDYFILASHSHVRIAIQCYTLYIVVKFVCSRIGTCLTVNWIKVHKVKEMFEVYLP